MTDHGDLDDAEMASLVPEWLGVDGILVRATAPAGSPFPLQIVQNMTTQHDLDDLCLLASGVSPGETRATDAGGYAIEGERVVVWDGGDNQVTVSRDAFTSLVRRLLAAALVHRGTGPAWAELASVADDLSSA